MTSKFLMAAISASFLFGAAAMAADAPTKAPAPSRAVSKQLQAAQTANNKKDYAAVIAALEEARKVSDRTPYDNYVISRFATSGHLGLKDYAAAALDAEVSADTDPAVIPENEKGAVYNTAMQLSSMAKHND